ncbi:MAG TPA: thioredoxin domain-containing protein, partial [Pseudonocardiaceae bacterium]|nr:thioredoxin domain-containing protein [Pseudonocardiaceae bacterium]
MSSSKGRGQQSVAALRQSQRRRRLMLVSAAVGILVVFAAVLGFGLYQGERSAVVVPPGATDDGIPIGNSDAPVTLDVFEDFQCPICAKFEQITGPAIEELVRAGTVRVVYHPVAFLDRMSSTQYSSRASAAAGCAAADGVYPTFATALFAQQPPEGGDGLPEQTLISIGEAAGAGPDFGTCVRDGTYESWTAQVTDAASRSGVTGTPTVLVNGREVADRTPDGDLTAVDEHGGRARDAAAGGGVGDLRGPALVGAVP